MGGGPKITFKYIHGRFTKVKENSKIQGRLSIVTVMLANKNNIQDVGGIRTKCLLLMCLGELCGSAGGNWAGAHVQVDPSILH